MVRARLYDSAYGCEDVVGNARVLEFHQELVGFTSDASCEIGHIPYQQALRTLGVRNKCQPML